MTLFLIVSATFFLVSMAPGDPILARSKQMPEKARAVVMEKYGLDKSIMVRYGLYMKKNLIFEGDLGESFIYTGRSVNDVIAKKMHQFQVELAV